MQDDLVERLGDHATRLTRHLWRAYYLAVEIENCERAIAEYAGAGISGDIHDVEHHRMRDDAMAKLKEHLSCVGVPPEAAASITTLTARLAALEQATPEEVVGAAAKALRDTPLLVPGTLFDLLCTTSYANQHVIALLLKDAVVNVLAATAPRLRAQGAMAERDRAAAVCEEIAEVYERHDQSGDAARECAVMIRAGGSGG